MNKLTIIAIVIFIIAGALLAFGLISNNNTKDTPIYNTPKETIFANLTNAYHKQNEGAYIADKDPHHERGIFVVNKTNETEQALATILSNGQKVQPHVWKIGTTDRLVNGYNIWGQTLQLDRQNVYVGFVEVGDFLVVFVGNDCELEAERVLSSVGIV